MSQERLEGDRPERGSAAGSEKHPPHEEDNPANDDASNLPATAHGSDSQDAEEQPAELDDESMYEQRGSGDKDHPPSGRD
jgi:hypothetical protein